MRARRRRSRSSRATGSRDGGRGLRARRATRPTNAPAQAADRHRAAVDRRRAVPDGRGDDRDVRRLLPAPASRSTRSSSSSGSPRSATRGWQACPVASSVAWTSRSRSSAIPSCSSSTSRPPASIRPPGARPGRSSSNLAALGKTVLLTTHYMDEAQHLADRVAVIARGRIVAEGTPSTLGGRDACARHDPLPPRPRTSSRQPGAGTRRRTASRASRRRRSGHAPLHELTGWALETRRRAR